MPLTIFRIQVDDELFALLLSGIRMREYVRDLIYCASVFLRVTVRGEMLSKLTRVKKQEIAGLRKAPQKLGLHLVPNGTIREDSL